MTDLYNRRDQEAVGIPISGTGFAISSGTLIGMNSSGNLVAANAHSGSTGGHLQVAAMGWALTGEKVGMWPDAFHTLQRLDAVDNPLGVFAVNSGSYTPGLPLFLSGGGNNLVNYSQTPPTNRGDIVQQVGIMITATTFRPHVHQPFVNVQSGGVLRPWRGPALDS